MPLVRCGEPSQALCGADFLSGLFGPVNGLYARKTRKTRKSRKNYAQKLIVVNLFGGFSKFWSVHFGFPAV